MNTHIELLIWFFLGLSVILLFFHRKKEGIFFVITSLVTAFIADRITISAALLVLLGFAVAASIPKLQFHIRTLAYAVLTAWCVALYEHWVPGISNLLILKSVHAGPQSAPFSMYLNLDKPLIFCALAICWAKLFGSGKTFRIRPLLAAATGLFCMLMVAWALGSIRPEIMLPSWWWIFALNNLLFTCIAEEALFRGYIQEGLKGIIGLWPALIIASILFGISHYHGGILLIAFATVAGLFYGMAFQYSSRLWVAVLYHFLFNFSHLFFFTYPSAIHS